MNGQRATESTEEAFETILLDGTDNRPYTVSLVENAAGESIKLALPEASYQRLENAATQMEQLQGELLSGEEALGKMDAAQRDLIQYSASLLPEGQQASTENFTQNFTNAVQRRDAVNVAFEGIRANYSEGIVANGGLITGPSSEELDQMAQNLAREQAGFTRNDENVIRSHLTGVSNAEARAELQTEVNAKTDQFNDRLRPCLRSLGEIRRDEG